MRVLVLMRGCACNLISLSSLSLFPALPLQGMTSHYLIEDCYKVTSDSTVLIHAGAGGMGQVCVYCEFNSRLTCIQPADFVPTLLSKV